MPDKNIRLDASESVFFSRQLEHIEKTVYETKYPQLKARSLIPVIPGIADWARVYTWRAYSKTGDAKIIANMAKDLPRADAKGEEKSTIIKPVGSAYGFDVTEIKAAAAEGVPLEQLKASAARYAIEREIDEILSLGSSADGLQGLLAITSAASYTPVTKAAGGVSWGTMAAPNATAEEVAADIMGIASARFVACDEQVDGFTIALPTAQYEYAATKRLGDGSDMTALKFALANSAHISRIVPWSRCNTAHESAYPRMACFPNDVQLLGAIVPQEFTQMAPELRNLEYVINCMARTGGVRCTLPIAVAYADHI